MLVKNTLFRYSGYSLIELIITIVLTSIVMTIFYTVFSQNQVKSVSSVVQVKAAELGQAYLEEISLKRFDELSPAGNATRCVSPACSTLGSESGESRSTFDDVDDYDGLSDSPPRDAFGNIRSGFNGFSVNVSVSYAGNNIDGLGLGLALQDLKRIQVTVIPPLSEGGSFVFTQYRGNF